MKEIVGIGSLKVRLKGGFSSVEASDSVVRSSLLVRVESGSTQELT